MDPQAARAWNHMTLVFKSTANYEKMLETAKRYVSAVGSEDAYSLLADAFALSGKKDAGLKTLYQTHELSPENNAAFLALIRLQLVNGDRDSARAGIKLLMERSHTMQQVKERLDLLIQIGLAHINSGYNTEAETFFRQAYELDLGRMSAAVFSGLGWCLIKQYKWADAESFYRQGLALNPRDPLILNGLVTIYLNRGEANKAIE